MKTAVKVTLILGTIFATLVIGTTCVSLTLWIVLTRAVAALQPAPQNEVVYSTLDKTELKLDLVQPGSGDGPFPLILWFHGGGWEMGDRKEYQGAMTNMAAQGYVGASIQYRFAPKYQFPAQLDDARAALAFLRDNAKTYKIDPERIGVVGGSAGGQLALLLGMAKKDDKPSGIKCIVSFAGPTDFRRWTIPEEGEAQLRAGLKRDLNGLLQDYLGTSDRDAKIMAEASPVTYVAKDNPAVLTIHGTADDIVPFTQAKLLHDALKKAKVTEKLMPIEGVGHAAGWTAEKLTPALSAMVDFLNEHLKGK